MFRQWSGQALGDGVGDGWRVDANAVVIAVPTETLTDAGPHMVEGEAEYELARWVSPSVPVPSGFSALVASWNATTPPGTWVEIAAEVSGSVGNGRQSGTFVLGRWAEDTDEVYRSSGADQSHPLGHVEFDQVIAHSSSVLSSWRVTVTLLRRRGSAASPRVNLVGATASGTPPAVTHGTPSCPGPAAGRVLDVPAYSQTLHRGEYPGYSNGGESWCSPTATAMLLAYWGRGPTRADYAWVDETYADPWVDHAAAGTFDFAYRGSGNWSFNAAYAGTFGLRAFVTRLRSLRDAELFIAAGIPLVASMTFTQAELDGAGYGTEGHLLVVAGFTTSGDVVCNDPASHLIASNDEVRTTYDRAQFERAWLASSGGTVYVIHPADVALPPRPAGTTAW